MKSGIFSSHTGAPIYVTKQLHSGGMVEMKKKNHPTDSKCYNVQRAC